MKALDLTGQRFGKLTVIERAPSNRYAPSSRQQRVTHTAWRCRCDCGKEAVTETGKLRSGHTKTCGCASGSPLVPGRRFGMLSLEKSLGNRKWVCRCDCGNDRTVHETNLRKTKSCGCHLVGNHPNKTHGRTLTAEYRSWAGAKRRCYSKTNPKFKDYGARGIRMCERWRTSFQNFYADMGPKPPNTTLDRRNNDGDYEPGNCRWATPAQQSANRRPSLLHNGVTIKSIAAARGINYYTLRAALKRGEDPTTFIPKGSV